MRALASDVVVGVDLRWGRCHDVERRPAVLAAARLRRSVVGVDRLILGEHAQCHDPVVASVVCRVAHPCGGEPLALRVPFELAFAVDAVVPHRKAQQRPRFPALARAAAAYVREDVDGWARKATFVGDPRFREVWGRAGEERLAEAPARARPRGSTSCGGRWRRTGPTTTTRASCRASSEGYEGDIRTAQLRVKSIRADPFAEVTLDDDDDVLMAKNKSCWSGDEAAAVSRRSCGMSRASRRAAGPLAEKGRVREQRVVTRVRTRVQDTKGRQCRGRWCGEGGGGWRRGGCGQGDGKGVPAR